MKYPMFVGVGAVFGFLYVAVATAADRYPTGDVGNGCTASIVWQPANKQMSDFCGVEVDITRINSNFVYVKTCK